MSVPVKIPPGSGIVDVAFICNATLSGIPMSRFVRPNIRGLEVLDKVPSFSFFIEHPGSRRRVLFDLGVRKDWWNLSPSLVQRMSDGGWKADVQKDVPEILEEKDIALHTINSIIWSHWHWDHVGDTSRFPESTMLVIGPGLSAEFGKLPLLESDYSGREVVELVDFELEIGGLPAHDFFGDGSFYLLSTPGHAVGHLSALARTTLRSSGEEGDTFILMGGDCCHHMGQMRPSEQIPLLCDVSFFTSEGTLSHQQTRANWEIENKYKGATTPFLCISDYTSGQSAATSPIQAVESLQQLTRFDNESVLVAISHDKSLMDVVELFPAFSNDWNRKGWAHRNRWSFLEDFGHSNRASRKTESLGE